MLTANSSPWTASTVTETLFDLIRQGKIACDRLLRENAYLRAEISRLTSENAELRDCLAQRPREPAS